MSRFIRSQIISLRDEKHKEKSYLCERWGTIAAFPAILPFLTTNYTTMLFALLLFLFSLLTSYGERHADDEKNMQASGKEKDTAEGEKKEESDSNPKPE